MKESAETGNPSVLVRFFIAVTNRHDKNNFREVSEVSFHRWPTSLIWAQDEAAHHGERVWWRKAGHDMAIKEQREQSARNKL